MKGSPLKGFWAWLQSAAKWLYPGMRVKRWMLLTLLGIALVVFGLLLIGNLALLQVLSDAVQNVGAQTEINFASPAVYLPVGIGAAVLGVALTFVSYFQFNRSVLSAVAPDARKGLADRIYQRRSLAEGQRIVVIGGGTGLSTMLRGLKERTSNITAIVTVTDNGGSSGRLTQQMGVLPPGDLRACLVALADAEPTLAALFQFRFAEGQEGLGGHAFGNLFLAAMTEIYKGNYEQAIAATSKVLAIRGKVYPSTLHNVCLLAEMEDGTVVEGETQIAAHALPIRKMYLRPENARPLPEALDAIKNADAIILGPGSVFTSVVPNLLVDGLADAINRSKAVKIYVCNVMTQPGETDGYSAADHVRALMEHAPGRTVCHHVLMNKELPDPDVLARYEKYGQKFVAPDADAVRALGCVPHAANLVSRENVVRHDSARLAEEIFRIIL